VALLLNYRIVSSLSLVTVRGSEDSIVFGFVAECCLFFPVNTINTHEPLINRVLPERVYLDNRINPVEFQGHRSKVKLQSYRTEISDTFALRDKNMMLLSAARLRP